MAHIDDSPCKRILFCTDFSPNADLAFEFALDATQRRPGSTLILLHVVPEPEAQFWKTYIYELDDVDQKARAAIDQKVAESDAPRIPDDVDFRVAFRVGRDYIKILEFAEEEDVDLIVIGRQGHSSFGTVLFGNVTERVARKAPCPVLVVPLDYEKRLAARKGPPHVD